jgi:soluble lytic murein transglycosylase-like protein
MIHRAAIVRETQFRFGIPAPSAALAAQIAQESGYNPLAKSPVGASGLLQFMPATGKWVGEVLGEPAQPTDPQWAIRAGVWYMRHLYDQVSYTRDCDRYGAALSSYNGGLGWHNKRRAAAANKQDFWGSVAGINPGITASNQRENYEYPRRIIYERQVKYRAIGGRLVCI